MLKAIPDYLVCLRQLRLHGTLSKKKEEKERKKEKDNKLEIQGIE